MDRTLWDMKREFQHNFLKKSGLKPHHYLLDFGCGPLRGGIPLIQYLDPGRYFGMEVRAAALKKGKAELQAKNLGHKRPTLLNAAATADLELDQKMDYIWAFSVLIHLTDEILDETLEFVSRHLKEDGCMYANINVGVRPNRKYLTFPVVDRNLGFYKKICSKHGLDFEDVCSLKEAGHVSGKYYQDNQRMLKIYIQS